MKHTKRSIHDLAKKTKTEYLEEFTKTLEHDFYDQQKHTWRFIRHQRKNERLQEYTHVKKETSVDYLTNLLRKNMKKDS